MVKPAEPFHVVREKVDLLLELDPDMDVHEVAALLGYSSRRDGKTSILAQLYYRNDARHQFPFGPRGHPKEEVIAAVLEALEACGTTNIDEMGERLCLQARSVERTLQRAGRHDLVARLKANRPAQDYESRRRR